VAKKEEVRGGSPPRAARQLVEVGRTVFAQRGYEATSVEEIAARAGISKPIVYEHFGGKEGLYAVIVDRRWSTSSAASSRRSRRATAERLERAALAFLVYVKERLAACGAAPRRPGVEAERARCRP